jgi:DNA-binding response OmpR family regulator
MLTAVLETESILDAVRHGVDEFVTEPATYQKVLAKLENLRFPQSRNARSFRVQL